MSIIYGMPIDEYHAHPALGSSGMKEILKSPKHFWSKYLSPSKEKDEPTAAMKFGNLYDCLVLEPELFADRYALEEEFNIPALPLLKEVGREAYDLAKQAQEKEKQRKQDFYDDIESSGREFLKNDDYTKAKAMKDVLIAHQLGFIVKNGIKQASIFWTDPETGIECKCRPDIMIKPDDIEYFPYGVMLDLKSTIDASAEGFGKQIFNLGYQISAAHYIKGFKSEFEIPLHEDVPWYWVCSEKSAPFESVFRPITTEQLIHGEYKALKALRLFKEAKVTGEWKGYSQEPEPAVTPGWIMKEINQIIEGEI